MGSKIDTEVMMSQYNQMVKTYTEDLEENEAANESSEGDEKKKDE